MDVIGCLAAFAPGDLQRLRYTVFISSLHIVKSKFIIVFPFVSHIYKNTAGIVGNDVQLIAPGGGAGINYSESASSNISVTFSQNGQTVSANLSYTISIAYCPV